uniref:Kinesin motor domain-containing protein n=1 Tax=Elaeophora elaphi TaxID=1147741 RepID=A0A0R3S4L6_9BILA
LLNLLKISDSRDKVILNGSSLAAVSECIEPSADFVADGINSLNSNDLRYEARQIRQVNTARVPPMIAQNISQRLSPLDKSKASHGSTKSHSPSTQPDLKDITSIVERQEAELRQELSRLKSNVQGEIANKTLLSNKSQMQSTRPGMTPLASSRSIEFNASGAKLSAVAAPSPRLPTPVRKNLGRSLIPTPRASALSRSAVRGLAGGSTPSLVLSSQHVYDDTRSECGGITHNEQRWADECF